ncbi:HAD-IIA family hydrolase [Rhodococcus sp. NPDC049939]|uniref:HAD-IIA family hydrolase n=1 Tax=Rhodococcus sp. NPDC049939 TaxID=3155511 RepID=UPI00340C81C3
MAGVKGVLLDIDGVLVTSWHPIDGAAAAVREVHERGLACAYLTNTTSRTCDAIADSLRAAGIEAESGEIVTAARLTAEYVSATYPGQRAWLLNSGDVAADLSGIELDEDDPQVVILGGAGPEFTHRALSRVVELMLDGVPVVAMHRGTTWATRDGLLIDVGTYLPGMEEVAGTNVVSVGKPSLAAFLTATELMGTEPDLTMMVGDDLTGDVLAAQRVGLIGALVRTGKFRQSILDLSQQRPDHVIDSIAQLPELLDEFA